MSESPADFPAETNAGIERYRSLDSLRGVGAFIVLFFHLVWGYFIVSIDQLEHGKDIINWIGLSPFRFLYDGPSAVVMFFVLSGFVLSLPYYSGKSLSYRKYLTRRVTRIYIPYIVAIGFGLFLRTLFYRGPIAGFPQVTNALWAEPITARSLLNHLLLVLSTDQRIDPVTWSLTIEMRISLIFPLMMFFMVRWNTVTVLITAFVISLIGLRVRDGLVGTVPKVAIDLMNTFAPLITFVIGALVAKYRGQIVRRLTDLPWFLSGMFGLSGLMLYNYDVVVGTFLAKWIPCDAQFLYYLTSGVGSGMIIAWVLSSAKAKVVLEHRSLLFLGHISYSLYLYHLMVLLGLIYSIGRFIPVWTTFALAFFLSFPIATFAYRWFEEPSMRLGRRLTASLPTRPIAA